jgi:HEAT repeat protein
VKATLDALIAALGHPDPKVRRAACDAYPIKIASRDPRVIAAPSRAFRRERELAARRKFAWALLKRKAPPELPLLLTLAKDRDDRVRGYASRVLLNQIRSRKEVRHAPGVARVFLLQLRSSKTHERVAAAWSLSSLRDPVAIPSLLRALLDPNSTVRHFAMKWVERNATPRTLPALRRVRKQMQAPITRRRVKARDDAERIDRLISRLERG